jgi:chromate transporter
VILAAALAGIAGGKLMPRAFAGAGHAAAGVASAPAVIDDTTPPPAHARFSRRHLAATVAVFLALWGIVLAALAYTFGWSGDFTQMGWFFTQAALVTFGGAYAVLPYVLQGTVDVYGWMTATQMIDGLALGETTPGPLIMIVTYVGFVGGWTKQIFGPDALSPLWAGVAGGAVATYFTFLPSYLFILIGGPLVEATHGDLKFTAPLIGITAAVVGVILNLAVFFAWHVLWPAGFRGGFEWFSALVGLAAFIALFKYKAGIIPVILACAAAGLAYTSLL